MSINAPSLFDLVPAQKSEEPIAPDGPNCGVIMFPDGSFKVFSRGIDAAALRTDNLTDEQVDQFEMGKRLTGLVLALSNPEIMSVLLDLADNADVIDPNELKDNLRDQ